MYDIFHHGAVNGVTGSCHQLSLDGSLFSASSLSSKRSSLSSGGVGCVFFVCGFVSGGEGVVGEGSGCCCV